MRRRCTSVAILCEVNGDLTAYSSRCAYDEGDLFR